MTTSTNELLNIIEFIGYTEETLEIIENTRSKVYNELIDTIHRLSYDECMMLIDKSHDMPEKIFDEILKRARYLWRAKEQCNH